MAYLIKFYSHTSDRQIFARGTRDLFDIAASASAQIQQSLAPTEFLVMNNAMCALNAIQKHLVVCSLIGFTKHWHWQE
jgi:hypothetical protein